MALCKECKHYKPKTESTGDCFGFVVAADTEADKCPQKAFTPR